MIVKLGKAGAAGEFGRVTRYLTERSADADRAQLVDTNLAGHAPRELAVALRDLAAANARCDRPALHVIMRLAPEEARTPRDWRAMIGDWREGMGMADTPYLAISHGPGHVHLVVSRVQFDGRVWNPHQSHRRSRELADRLEERYHLERVRDHPRRRGERSLTRAEYERAQRRGEPPSRVGVAARVDMALRAGDGSVAAFVRALDASGITARVNQSPSTGRVHGVSFEDREARPGERSRYKGSELGVPWRVLERAIEERTPPRERAVAPTRERVRTRGGADHGR